MQFTPTQGDHMQPSRNIAARAGRWSAQHRKTALLGWIAFVVLAFVIGGKIGTNTLTNEESGVGQSGQADRIVAGAYPDRVEELVFIQSKTLKTGDRAFHAVVSDVRSRLAAIDGVTKITTPYGAAHEGAVAPKDDAVLVTFEIPGDMAEDVKVAATVDATVAAVDAAQKAHPDLRIEQSGSGSTEDEFMALFNSDLQKAGTTSLPLTLIILLIAFGALVAAGIPLLLAITGVVATMGLVGPLSQLTAVDDSVNHVILLIGLAVGVDYSLFYLRRVREERAAGRDNDAAIEAAAATSGRAVLISGVTVMIAMAGMYFGGASTFTSFATGTIAVVAVAMLGSLTVLPAMLSLCGDRVNKGRVPGLDRLKASMAEFGLWSRVVDRVMRRPLVYALATVALLLAMAAPALHMDTGSPGTDTLPQELELVQKFEHLKAAFPSETDSLAVVIKAKDVTAPAVTAARGEARAGDAARQDAVPRRRRLRARRQPGRDGRHRLDPGRARRAVRAGAGRAARRARAGDARQGRRPAGLLDRRHGHRSRLQRLDDLAPAARVRVRHPVGVPAAAADVPLDRHPGQGDRPEPAVDRCRLRRDGAGLPARLVQRPARRVGDGADRVLDPAVHVRRAVRAVDGLPRVHPHPRP